MGTKKSSQSQPSRSAASKKRAGGRPAAIKRNPAVNAWFARLEHPLKEEMVQVREIILAADERMEESVKWSTPTFSFKGNLASFIPQAKKSVSLMFHTGADIPGEHPRLEGDAARVRTMRFADLKEIKKHRRDLERVVRAWCKLKAAG